MGIKNIISFSQHFNKGTPSMQKNVSTIRKVFYKNAVPAEKKYTVH